MWIVATAAGFAMLGLSALIVAEMIIDRRFRRSNKIDGQEEMFI